MATAIEILSFVARRLISFERKIEAAPAHKRPRFSAFFRDLGQSLEAIELSLRAGRPPHRECRRLITLALELNPLLGEEVGEAEAERLQGLLLKAGDAEKMLGDFSAAARRAFNEEEMRKAHILLLALALGLGGVAGPGPGAEALPSS